MTTMTSSCILPVVLAGGSGTRLWPLSRQLYPKQFLSLAGPHTLFQQAILRLDTLADGNSKVQPGCAIGNEEHRFFLREQLRAGKLPDPRIMRPETANVLIAKMRQG